MNAFWSNHGAGLSALPLLSWGPMMNSTSGEGKETKSALVAKASGAGPARAAGEMPDSGASSKRAVRIWRRNWEYAVGLNVTPPRLCFDIF